MPETSNLHALFFGSHPDDVELCCGGTAAKLVKSGRKVGIADLTRAELSTRGTLKTRQEETEKAGKVLGISVRENLGLEDGNIVNDKDSRLKVIEVIRKHKPQVIFAPYPYDRHPDHINASKLITDATFYSGLEKIKTKGLEAYRPAKVFYYPQAYDIPVSFIVDISDTFETKLEAIQCYGTQFFNKDYKGKDAETLISSEKFYKQIEARARNYGFKIGAEFGEGFFTHTGIKVSADMLFEI